MTCSVSRADRPDHVAQAVLDAFEELEPEVGVTPATLLGKHGLGHSPVRRQVYHAAITRALERAGDCRMGTLRKKDFKDTDKFKTVADVIKAVTKDLV